MNYAIAQPWFIYLALICSRDWFPEIYDRPHYLLNLQIYVVDSLDRERIGRARAEFQAIINDPFMLNSVLLVFANKQDMRGAMTPMEVCEGLGLYDLTNRVWHIQGTCALKGDGLYEGLDWLATTLDEMRASGRTTSTSSS